MSKGTKGKISNDPLELIRSSLISGDKRSYLQKSSALINNETVQNKNLTKSQSPNMIDEEFERILKKAESIDKELNTNDQRTPKKTKKKNVYKPRSKIVDPIINEIGSDSSEDKTEIVNKQLSELYSLIDLEDDDEDRDKKKNTTKEIKFFSNEKNFDFEKFVTKSKNEQKQEQKFELDLDLDLDLDLEEKIEQKIKQRKQLQKPKDKDFQNQDKSNSKFKLGSKTKNKQELNLGSGSESESDSDWGELLLNIELDDKTSLDSLVSNFVGSEKKRKQTQSNYKKPNIDSNPNSIVSQDMNEKLKFDERDYLSGSNFKTNKNSTNENQKEKHKQNKNKNKDIKERPNSEFNASNMNLESLLSNFELTEKSSISNEDDEDFDEQDNLEDLFDENGELSKDFLPKYKSKDYSHLVWKESDDFSSTNINTNINSLNSTNINSESNKNPKTNTKTKTNTNTNINTNTNTKIKTKTKTKAKTKSNTKTNINSNTNPKSNPNTRIFHTKPKSKTIQPKKVNKVVKKIKHNSLGFVESFISSEGAKQINLDLMKGFEYCIIENIFQGDPEDIAKFFFSNPRIKPERIGEYLELDNNDTVSMLQYFLSYFNFCDELLTKSLIKFWERIILPVNKKLIEQCFAEFGKEYFKQNPKLLSSAENVTKIAFKLSIIRSNSYTYPFTDLEDFMDFCKSVEKRIKLPKNFLKNCYNHLFEKPIPFFSSDLNSVLRKQGGKIKTWKRRWFVFTNECLYYYQTINANQPLGIIPLSGIEIKRETAPKSKRGYQFRIVKTGNEEKFGYKKKNLKDLKKVIIKIISSLPFQKKNIKNGFGIY